MALVKREVIGRYRGSVLGICWSFFNPLLMLMVYTFVFSMVFKARWGIEGEGKADFAITLFAGLLVFNFFSECISRAPTLITHNSNYVKKVVFPLEILPYVLLGASLFHTLISVFVWVLFYLCCKGLPPIQIVFAPVVVLPLVILTLGLSWLIASLGVFLRDITQIISLVITVLLFLSPVFYPISALPAQAQVLMQYNPIAASIEQVRGVLLYGQLPSVSVYLGHLAFSLLAAWGCFAWFQKTRRAFADVI